MKGLFLACLPACSGVAPLAKKINPRLLVTGEAAFGGAIWDDWRRKGEEETLKEGSYM